MYIAEIKVSYNSLRTNNIRLNNSQVMYETVMQYWDKDLIELQEEMKLILLDRAIQLLGVYSLSKGGISATVVDVKLLLGVALKCAASHIVLVHNHPTGNLQPSKADISITNKVKKATRQVDLLLLDHLIISKDWYYSFADDGKV